MRTVIIIPARLAATRLPDKPLAALGGLPLVARVARQAQQVPGVDTVIVATADRAIADAAAADGHRVEWTRADHPSGTDRVAEVARRLEAELILNLQGDEPFIDPAALRQLLDHLEGADASAPMATLAAPLDHLDQLHDPAVVKVVMNDAGRALYFSRAPIPHDRSGAGALTDALQHIGVYAYRRAALLRLAEAPVGRLEAREGLEQLRALEMGIGIGVVVTRSIQRGIDTPEDLRRARAYVERLGETAFPRTLGPAIT